MQEMPERPTPPQDDECCGGGCTPCVWDRYYEALERWQEELLRRRATAAKTSEP